jgi:hypothetical protein|tara:strand:- start:213 stop:434 length:222 start_codon:yes stop_codon:yes gene_type:complete
MAKLMLSILWCIGINMTDKCCPVHGNIGEKTVAFKWDDVNSEFCLVCLIQKFHELRINTVTNVEENKNENNKS